MTILNGGVRAAEQDVQERIGRKVQGTGDRGVVRPSGRVTGGGQTIRVVIDVVAAGGNAREVVAS